MTAWRGGIGRVGGRETQAGRDMGTVMLEGGDLQDGGGVRRGDHLPPHKYIRNTPTCETTPTEYLLNAGRGPQTSETARKSPSTWPCA